MPLWKITDKGPSKVKEIKFKQHKTCRDEIIECAQTVMRQSGLGHFTIPEIISCMAKRRSRYAESTIRTHIASRMCANAPDNHAVTYRDIERTDRGEYQLLR
jgi:hypothetical protein